MLVGISAVVIGLCALGVSMYETSLMREEQRASVIPLMELGHSYNISTSDPAKTRFRLIAQNVGIGPARVRDFKVTVDGAPHVTWDSAMRELTGHDEKLSYSFSAINGRTIPPDRTVEIFVLKELELIEKVLGDQERLEFEACFCSIFDECWITSSSTFGAASEVESCSRDDGSFSQ